MTKEQALIVLMRKLADPKMMANPFIKRVVATDNVDISGLIYFSFCAGSDALGKLDNEGSDALGVLLGREQAEDEKDEGRGGPLNRVVRR